MNYFPFQPSLLKIVMIIKCRIWRQMCETRDRRRGRHKQFIQSTAIAIIIIAVTIITTTVISIISIRPSKSQIIIKDIKKFQMKQLGLRLISSYMSAKTFRLCNKVRQHLQGQQCICFRKYILRYDNREETATYIYMYHILGSGTLAINSQF